MSSVLHTLSQTPVLSKFLIAIGSDVCGNTIEECSAFSSEWMGTITETISGSYAFFSTGDLFRDLGRQMMLVDADGSYLALYREAMPQANANTEGVATAPVWLRVWAADGAAVRVARLG